MKLIAIFTTTGNADEARRIARAVVERRLAACAQITEIETFFERAYAPYAQWIDDESSGQPS